mgnify:FL=1
MSENPDAGPEPTDNLPAPASWPSGYPEVAEGSGATASTPVGYSQTSTNAVIALVLAIASWVGWGLCPIIGPLALAIVALVLSSNALKEIRAGAGRVTGEGLVTAARIVAWVNIGVTAAAVVIGAFFLVLALVAGALNNTGTF